MNAAEFNHHYHSQPHEVSVETQALCNARCTFCPYPTIERKGVKMSDEMLDKIMDEFETFKVPFYFSPFKLNEPLLDKRTIPLCERFNQKVPHGALRIFSNGSALIDSNIAGVAKLKSVAHLWISLNEVNAAAYETTMGLNFDLTAKRLDRLHIAVGFREFRHPVVLSRVGGTSEERAEFSKYTRERWPLFKTAIIKRDAWIDFTNSDELTVPAKPCVRWWELNITAEGKVALCCMHDGEDPRYLLGDIHTQTMLEVYNSPGSKARRQLTDRREAAPMACVSCTY